MSNKLLETLNRIKSSSENEENKARDRKERAEQSKKKDFLGWQLPNYGEIKFIPLVAKDSSVFETIDDVWEFQLYMPPNFDYPTTFKILPKSYYEKDPNFDEKLYDSVIGLLKQSRDMGLGDDIKLRNFLVMCGIILEFTPKDPEAKTSFKPEVYGKPAVIAYRSSDIGTIMYSALKSTAKEFYNDEILDLLKEFDPVDGINKLNYVCIDSKLSADNKYMTTISFRFAKMIAAGGYVPLSQKTDTDGKIDWEEVKEYCKIPTLVRFFNTTSDLKNGTLFNKDIFVTILGRLADLINETGKEE